MGLVYCCVFAHLAAKAVFPPLKTLPNSFVKTNLPVTPLGTRIYPQNPRNSMKTRNFWGEGEGGIWYGPGASLTEQTGSIPDIVQQGQRHVEAKHALESEQCDGREATVHRGV